MDALLFAINLEVMLLQLRILGITKEKTRYFRQFVRDVIRSTLVEVAEDGEWQTLQHAAEILEHSSSSAVALRASYENLKISLEAICNELLTKKYQWALEFRTCDEKVAYLRDKIKDTALNTNTQLSYADKWLCARGESMELRFQFDSVLPAGPNSDYEHRVHNELLRAYELQIKEREESLEHWKSRYANDTAMINERLKVQCEKLRETSARRTELQQLYELHQGEMRAWLTFKRERAARRAREQRLRAAATRVQAWWRGVMVRRALGAYRFLRNAKTKPAKAKRK
ncbi:dynein regulatory complex protein 9-like [Epargyreus clarus]|uniref:dynein regulatory complex protein 9-like n=1 Tax=Epargyreus clarus TaxID=520877 RepID=UPI003C2AF823